MIDTRDLRIGSLIKYDNRVCTVEILSRTRLSIKYQYDGTTVTAFNAHFDDVDGIKITDEWIERLGLEKDDYYDYFRWLTSNYQVAVETSPSGAGFSVLDEYSDYEFVRNIEYIHQLQNLIYDFTGQELTMEVEHETR